MVHAETACMFATTMYMVQLRCIAGMYSSPIHIALKMGESVLLIMT